MKNKVTIKEIAKATGVSDTTVSWALHDHPLISESTKKKVLSYVEKVHYTPNIPARSLRMSKTHIIGVVMNDISNPFYAKILKGIERKTRKAGYTILLCNSNWDPETEKSLIEILLQYNADGVIATPTQGMSEGYLQLLDHKIPLTFVETAIDGVDANHVVPDTVMDGYLATGHLVGLGHRRIIHITGEAQRADFPSFVNIITGFKKALFEGGIAFKENMVWYGGLHIEDGYSAMRKILKAKERPTAVFAVNDMTAIGVMSAIDEAGLNIPEDISVIGIDDTYLGALPRISLTTIAEPEMEMGERAVEILLENIRAGESKKKYTPKRIVVKPKLIRRGSCRKIDGGGE